MNACINAHGEILHFKRNVAVAAHHVANREKFLPPLEILAAADCNVVPYAVSGLGNRTRLEQTVYVGQTALDAGILAVNVEDAAHESACRCDRVSTENHHVGWVKVDADHTIVPGNSSIAMCSMPHFLQCVMYPFQNSMVTFRWYS